MAKGKAAKKVQQNALVKALQVALRQLPEDVVIDVLSANWCTLARLDALKARFP